MSAVKDYPPYLDYPKPRKPQTNADRIRSMSDEELAELLCIDHCVQIRGNNKLCDGTCFLCVEEWLRQPVKDGDS